MFLNDVDLLFVQVHSLNILRALFKDARLGQDVAPYVSQGLKASILGFKSEYWEVGELHTNLED